MPPPIWLLYIRPLLQDLEVTLSVQYITYMLTILKLDIGMPCDSVLYSAAFGRKHIIQIARSTVVD